MVQTLAIGMLSGVNQRNDTDGVATQNAMAIDCTNTLLHARTGATSKMVGIGLTNIVAFVNDAKSRLPKKCATGR
jgi:hypothetical protein